MFLDYQMKKSEPWIVELADHLVNAEQITKEASPEQEREVDTLYEFVVTNYDNNDNETFKLIIDDHTITNY